MHNPINPEKCRFICVTPTRNESWIIRHFLRAAQTWADEVVVADQLSEDGTRDILRDAPGVTTVWNDSPEYDEQHRQKLLLASARRFGGKRILVGLDADEALSANCKDSKEWDMIADARPGTILRFKWVNILPGFEQVWIPPKLSAFGYVDDGVEHSGTKVHSPRVPQPAGAPILDLQEIVVLHFQYVLWERMLSKQRWYQAWEFLQNRRKGALQIYREYHHMLGSWNPDEIYPLDPAWLTGYKDSGVDFRNLEAERVTWWDREMLKIFQEFGPGALSKLDVWGQDWSAVSERLGSKVQITDPRTAWERGIHRLLALTQNRRELFVARVLEWGLRKMGW